MLKYSQIHIIQLSIFLLFVSYIDEDDWRIHVEIIPDFYYLIGEEFNKTVEEFLKNEPNLLYIWLYGFSVFIHVNSKNCYRFRLMAVICLKFENSIADVFRWTLALQFIDMIVIIPFV